MAYTEKQIHDITENQRRFFRTGNTLELSWRREQLKKLRDAVIRRSSELEDALMSDLGRSRTEAYLCDIGPVLMEIGEILQKLRHWARPRLCASGIVGFPSVFTRVYSAPYGVSLIISPSNFPLMLTLGALAASLAGGNTAILKTSSKSPACTAVMQRLIADIYPEEYVTVIDGGHDVADFCLAQRTDKIFYTGSTSVARHVLTAAAQNITPVALELGGETGNWCIVRKDAALADAARKIAFMKLCNAGQVCININQVAVAEEVADAFLEELKKAFLRQIGSEPEKNPEYPHLLTDSAYRKCASAAEKYRDRIVFGGVGDPVSRRYAPTILYPIGIDEEIVRRELFCPILPIVTYPDREIDRVLETVADREHPLAFYLFTKDIHWAKRTMRTQQFGGGCINEVCIHLMTKGAPFNGVGHSGMGAYHGEWGFREFTHPVTVLMGKTRCNLPLREHPYDGNKNAWKLRILRLLER